RRGRLTSIRIGFTITIPPMIGLVLSTDWRVALVFVALVGVGIFMPFSVFVVLGQDYLPNRIGTASGVTVGLAVTVGGLFNPLLGLIADNTSLQVMFGTLIALPLLGLLFSVFLHDPDRVLHPVGESASMELG
ncbi:MAG: hypothetical protein ACYCZK_02570, partial [Microbacteriaceae bacterium]